MFEERSSSALNYLMWLHGLNRPIEHQDGELFVFLLFFEVCFC
jgi:hypothetical protein